MAPTKKNSNFVAISVLVTPLSYRRSSLTSKAETISILVVPTSRVPRYLSRKNASPTPPLVLTMKPTASTHSTSLAPVSHIEPQDFKLHLCLPSLKNPPRQCSRFPHPLPLVWIFAVSLLSKNLKWMKSSSILVAFLTLPQRHVRPCIMSPRRNAPAYLVVWNHYKFTTPKSEKLFFCPDDIERCMKGSRRKWVDKYSVDQERPPILPCGLSRLAPTSLVRRSWSLKMQASSSRRKNASRQLASSTLQLFFWTSPEYMFLPTPTLIFYPCSPRLRDVLLLYRQQNKCRWSHLHELWTGPFWRSLWFHALDLVACSRCNPNLHLHNLSTNLQSVLCPSILARPSRIWYQSLAANKILSCTANTCISYLLRYLMQTLKLICSYTPLPLTSMKSNSS